MDWKEWIDGIDDPEGIFDKEGLKDLIENTANDGEQIIRENGEKLIEYTTLLANGELSLSDYELFVRQTKRQMEANAILEGEKVSIEVRERAKKIASRVGILILNILISKLLK